MAIKTFTTGEVLTAADTNTYLANSGLVYIGTYSASGGTILADGAFSSTYTNYSVVATGIVTTAVTDIAFQFRYAGPTTQNSQYYFALTGGTYLGAASAIISGNNSGYLNTGPCFASSPKKAFNMTVLQSNEHIGYTIQTYDINGNFYQGTGYVNQSRSYTGFFMSCTTAATITAGTVRVYGYREA